MSIIVSTLTRERVSWQITPLTEALAASGDEAKRAFDAMISMKKVDVAAIKAAWLTLRLQAAGSPAWRAGWKVVNGSPARTSRR